MTASGALSSIVSRDSFVVWQTPLTSDPKSVWMSIACSYASGVSRPVAPANLRIVVYSPQIHAHQSGEGLSVMFILLAGDLCNLLGAALAGLIPTVIILVYFVSSSLSNSVNLQYLSRRWKHSLCEGMLFCQIFYYRWKHRQLLLKLLPNDDSEGAPL